MIPYTANLDWRMTTAQILYRMPDHLEILQTFVWQEFDLAPRFPKLRDFLDFWQRSLDGPLYAVTVVQERPEGTGRWRFAESEITLH
jgi:uncharacterized protein Usg